jgi:hypothetical protein
VVEAFRHAPRTNLGAPTASLFGEICHAPLRIVLGGVELVLQIRDVNCLRKETHAHEHQLQIVHIRKLPDIE